jgi:protein TonB
MLNSKFDLYKTEWLDLVFADRNKAYGAYDLRNHYGDNMMKALAITVLGITVAAVSLTISFKHDVVDIIPPVQIIPNIPITPPLIEKPVEAKKRVEPPKGTTAKPAAISPQVNANTQRVVPPVLTTNPVTTDPPVIDPNKQIAGVNNTADPSKPTTGILDAGKTPGKNPGEGVDKGIIDNTPYDPSGLDEMPSPVGGQAAWSKFLQKNLRYPDTDQEGRVIISFIIEKDGHLTDLKILKGVVSELDREAMRVLALAPAWKPGLQNGKPVRVKYTIPIIFQMNQQ